MLQILAAGVSANCHGNFFTMKVLARIVGHVSAKGSPRKRKVSTEKLSSRRTLQACPVGNHLGQKKDTSLGSELVGNHAPRILDSSNRIGFRILARNLGRQDGFLWFWQQTLKHLDYKSVPTLLKSHVTVDLQSVQFILVQRLNLRTSPASSLGFVARHIQDAKSFVFAILVQLDDEGIVIVLLVANAKDNIIGMVRFVETVLESPHQFRISVSCDTDKDGHLWVFAKFMTRETTQNKWRLILVQCFSWSFSSWSWVPDCFWRFPPIPERRVVPTELQPVTCQVRTVSIATNAWLPGLLDTHRDGPSSCIP